MNDRNDIAPIKSMELFLIDNQQAWAAGSKLIGDYIVWPDDGMYPGYAPVGILTHPNFKGKIVMHAVIRGIVITLSEGARDADDCRKQLSAKQRPEQYRVAVEAIVHRLILAGAGTDGDLKEVPSHAHQQGVEPLALIAWLAKTAPKEAAVLSAALSAFSKAPRAIAYGPGGDAPELTEQEAFAEADHMLITINEAQRSAPAGA